MPHQKGNERRQEYYHEEREASDSGCMPRMWHQDVPNRKELRRKLPAQGNHRDRVFTQSIYHFLLPITKAVSTRGKHSLHTQFSQRVSDTWCRFRYALWLAQNTSVGLAACSSLLSRDQALSSPLPGSPCLYPLPTHIPWLHSIAATSFLDFNMSDLCSMTVKTSKMKTIKLEKVHLTKPSPKNSSMLLRAEASREARSQRSNLSYFSDSSLRSEWRGDVILNGTRWNEESEIASAL